MQHELKSPVRIGSHKRRALALAVGAVLATVRAAHAFDIDTGNPDIQMRWDNTVRYNLGMRAESQDSRIIGNPNFDDGDRNFNSGSLVTNRFDVLSEFDFIYRKKYGFRVSGAGWYDFAYQNLDNTSNATANTLVDGLPVAGVLSPYTKRYAKGFSGEFLDAFVFANFDVGDVPVNVKAGQHTVYWGDSLLLGGAIHGVSYGQNPLDVWKGFATPGSEAKELFRPRGGLTLQAQPTKELSVAGQWFYNWQADRIPESGSYLTIQDPLNFGGESFIFGPNPLAASIPGAPAFLRLWRSADIKPPSTSGSLDDYGISARWSPAWLDGTLGFYYRNTNDVFPQAMATPGVIPAPAALCSSRGGQPLPGGTLCFVNPQATTPADLQKFGKLGTYNGAYGDNIHIYGITLAKNIFGVSFGAELSYRQNMPLRERPGAGAARGVRGARAGCDRHDRHSVEGHAGRAWRHVCTASSTPYGSCRRRRCSTRRRLQASSRGCNGRRSRRTRRSSRGAAATRRSTACRGTSSASRSTSRRPGSRSCPASTCSRR